MISAQQSHISSCIQFLDKENNYIVLGCAEIFLFLWLLCMPLGGDATMSRKCEIEWVSEWVRVTIESRTSPVFDTMLPVCLFWSIFVVWHLHLRWLGASYPKERRISSETNCFVLSGSVNFCKPLGLFSSLNATYNIPSGWVYEASVAI